MRVSPVLAVVGPVVVLLAASIEASATAVVASVESAWRYDPGTRLYTYSYRVTNAAASPNHVRTLLLRPTARPLVCTAPPGWRCFRGWMGDSTAVAWAVIDPGPEPPNWNHLPFVGPTHVAPGETQSGFRLISDRAPDSTAQFVAQGFDTIPGGAHSYTPPPLNPTIWEEGWVGSAIVPTLRGESRTAGGAPTGVGLATPRQLARGPCREALRTSTGKRRLLSALLRAARSASDGRGSEGFLPTRAWSRSSMAQAT